MRPGRTLILLAGFGFVLTCIAGLAGAVVLAAPDLGAWLPFETLRPLHEMLALGSALCGAAGIVLALVGPGASPRREVLPTLFFASFLVTGVGSILLGHASGREYFAWPPAAGLLLLAGLLALLGTIFGIRGGRVLAARSQEGYWLVGFGTLFVLAGTLEASLSLLPAIAGDIVRDLSVQWHAIDTLFAGLNALLYGCGILVLGGMPKPLRSLPLFGLAAFGLLFTFAHHHYVSPQPTIFKSLGVAASMVALLSFFRHLAAFRKAGPGHGVAAPFGMLWRSIEIWTLVSILSGVLFAVPQLNLLVHGTPLVIAHAMGSMVGVDVMMVIACGLALAPHGGAIATRRLRAGVALVNLSLAALWLALGADGLGEGLARLGPEGGDAGGVHAVVRVALPGLGLALTAGIALISVELMRGHGVLRARLDLGVAEGLPSREAGTPARGEGGARVAAASRGGEA